jgi:hypothetical protein
LEEGSSRWEVFVARRRAERVALGLEEEEVAKEDAGEESETEEKWQRLRTLREKAVAEACEAVAQSIWPESDAEESEADVVCSDEVELWRVDAAGPPQKSGGFFRKGRIWSERGGADKSTGASEGGLVLCGDESDAKGWTERKQLHLARAGGEDGGGKWKVLVVRADAGCEGGWWSLAVCLR